METRPCRIEACDKPTPKGRRICAMHAARLRRHGDIDADFTGSRSPYLPPDMQGNRSSAAERFDYFTPDRGDGCWEWRGPVSSGTGYARLNGDGKLMAAHRWSYEHFVGPIPQGMLIRHKCDNPPCVNPAHLELGTVQDNTNDMIRRGRMSQGDRCAKKLTSDDVRAIRARAVAGERHAALAREYGVNPTLISDIVKRKVWKSVA